MGTLIDGIAASQAIDSSGEILSIEGIDITDLIEGRGVYNFEHTNDDPEDIVGKVLYAKKIFSEKDCESERQRYFWKKINTPYIYAMGELFDDEGHAGAAAIAAMMKYCKKNNQPMVVGYSIEGSTLARDGNMLNRAVGKKIAITVKPCNKQCASDLMDQDPNIKKAMGFDGFESLAKGMECDLDECVLNIDQVEAERIIQDLEECATELTKALSAGVPMATPGNNVQGAALQGKKEKISKQDWDFFKDKIKKAIRNRKDGQSMEDVIKAELPQLGEKFSEHFKHISQGLTLTKAQRAIISHRDTLAHIPHEKDQKHLVSGIHARPYDGEHFQISRNSLGRKVKIKKSFMTKENPVHSGEKAVAFANIANGLFGLRGMILNNAVFLNPSDSSIYHAEELTASPIRGHDVPHGHEYDQMIRNHSEPLRKLAMADYVLGMPRDANSLVFVGTEPKATDNEDAFSAPAYPEYLHSLDKSQKVVSLEEFEWLSKISPKTLASFVVANGMPTSYAKAAVQRLEKLKQNLRNTMFLDSIYEE